MFTGIVTDMGTVRAIRRDGDTRFEFTTSYDLEPVAVGASIACGGCCLTVIEKGADWFAVQASAETLDKTNLGRLKVGDRLNLEKALKVGDELGGHIVSGHVDAQGVLIDARPEGESLRLRFRVPDDLKYHIAPKGSVTIDGVSLTVNEVEDDMFGINLIPHTRETTTLGRCRPGAAVNLEIDMLARYVARLMEGRRADLADRTGTDHGTYR